MTYADTGFVCSLLAPDANTAAAVKRMRSQKLPLAWTWLHEVEFRNAARLRVFQNEMSQAEADRTLQTQLADLAAGVYSRLLPDQTALLSETERLSAQHSARIGTRSLDVLHVAAALVLGATEFLTFDKHQAKLAKAAGLRVPILASQVP
ncbi:MAG: type II toxin-antitoxin system VapC family toxin [Verrucomicrobiales bacterium]|nr:type II toxin-antitoxin system VapC family toxin [Verrucomicrobiales bacterium]